LDVAVIKTAGRVFEVFEYFREVRRALTVREISEHLSYPLSSTAVLMRSMAALGYLSYNQRLRAYFPTARLPMLVDWVYEQSSRGGALTPFMQELAERTDETVILAVQNDIFAQYIEVIQSSQTLQLYLPPGTRRLMCVSGLGWAMLAAQPDAAAQKMAHRTNLRIGKNEKKIDVDELLERLAEVRKKGYAFSHGAVSPGAGVIAMALPSEENEAQLGIGIGSVLERLEPAESRIVKTLRDTMKKYDYGTPVIHKDRKSLSRRATNPRHAKSPK